MNKTNTQRVLDIILELCETGQPFTSDDIRPHLPENIGPRSIPPACAKAQRDGIIEEIDRVKSTIPERKGSRVAVYRPLVTKLSEIGQSDNDGQYQNSTVKLSSVADEIVELKNYFNSTGYVIGVEDLAAYLILLASRNWVVLAGPSGTGKSSLVTRVSEALGSAFYDVQVKPNWVSSEDSLGYYSELSKEFIPGPVYVALQEAAKSSQTATFVRFDEMNLAAPEYYLAELLSAAEEWTTGEDGSRASEEIQLPPMPEGLLVEPVYIGDNVHLVGTVNMDETTRTLSPKVLDRAAVMEFSDVDLYSVGKEEKADDNQAPSTTAISAMIGDRFRTVREMRLSPNTIDLIGDILTRIQDDAALLGGSIGYRQRDALLAIVALVEKYGLDDIFGVARAIDVGILTCIVPKWHGSAPGQFNALERIYSHLTGFGHEGEHEAVHAIEASAKTLFPRTSSKLQQMMRQYEVTGFFSYW